MRSLLITPIVLLFSACGGARSFESVDLIIRHVNVVDVMSGTVVADQVIVIKAGRFLHVGKDSDEVAVAAGTTVIDGTGQYAIPGLWDMHVHVCWSDTNASLLLPTLLAHGITGVRDMGGDLRILNAFKQRVLDDPKAGPDLFGCGPIIDGNPPVFPDFTLPVDTTTDLPEVLDSLAANGADFFKVYSLLGRAELERIAAYSKAHDKVFAGHLSEYVEPGHAIELGQHSIEHLNRLEEVWADDRAQLDTLIATMITHGTWVCPTLVTYQRKSHMHDPTLRDTVMDALLPALQAEWAQMVRKRMERYGSLHQRDSLEQRYRMQLELVKHLQERGVPLLAGSDLAGMAFVYPGTSLWEELDLLARAGLSNAAVLRSATLSPAEYLGVQAERGSITPGKIADLLILEGDPLEDIRMTREQTHIVHRGIQVR